MNGIEWVVEAHGCDPDALKSQRRLEHLFDSIVVAMSLHPLGAAAWHQFPEPGGITGVALLAESHLACHTFPEYRSLCLNLFCCRPREDAGFEALLKTELGAARVRVRSIERPYELANS